MDTRGRVPVFFFQGAPEVTAERAQAAVGVGSCWLLACHLWGGDFVGLRHNAVRPACTAPPRRRGRRLGRVRQAQNSCVRAKASRFDALNTLTVPVPRGQSPSGKERCWRSVTVQKLLLVQTCAVATRVSDRGSRRHRGRSRRGPAFSSGKPRATSARGQTRYSKFNTSCLNHRRVDCTEFDGTAGAAAA